MRFSAVALLALAAGAIARPADLVDTSVAVDGSDLSPADNSGDAAAPRGPGRGNGGGARPAPRPQNRPAPRPQNNRPAPRPQNNRPAPRPNNNRPNNNRPAPRPNNGGNRGGNFGGNRGGNRGGDRPRPVGGDHPRGPVFRPKPKGDRPRVWRDPGRHDGGRDHGWAPPRWNPDRLGGVIVAPPAWAPPPPPVPVWGYDAPPDYWAPVWDTATNAYLLPPTPPPPSAYLGLSGPCDDSLYFSWPEYYDYYCSYVSPTDPLSGFLGGLLGGVSNGLGNALGGLINGAIGAAAGGVAPGPYDPALGPPPAPYDPSLGPAPAPYDPALAGPAPAYGVGADPNAYVPGAPGVIPAGAADPDAPIADPSGNFVPADAAAAPPYDPNAPPPAAFDPNAPPPFKKEH